MAVHNRTGTHADSPPDTQPGSQPWYRRTSAVFAAGGVGLALVAALVVTVVQMSDEWSKPVTTVLTTTGTTAPPTSRDKQPLIITPSDTSTSTFPTSVSLSTTDIGIPSVTATTSGTETTGGTEPPASEGQTTFPSQGRPGSTKPSTTRTGPRLNETRTYSPGY